MATYAIYLLAALLLGIFTSISPCPMATNIAAISYIGRKVESPYRVLEAGLLYTLGRCALYFALAALLTTSALSLPAVDRFLQKYMHLVLGPILLVLGAFLLGMIRVAAGGAGVSEGMQRRIDAMGIWGALALGALFAVSFCPTSAALFFGLIALTMGLEARLVTTYLESVGIVLPSETPAGDVWILPLVYGIGTALPVIFMAILLAFSARSVGKAYTTISRVEWAARTLTGWVFVLVGAYFILLYVFEVPLRIRWPEWLGW